MSTPQEKRLLWDGHLARPGYLCKRHHELRSQQKMKVDFQDRSNTAQLTIPNSQFPIPNSPHLLTSFLDMSPQQLA